MLGLYRFALGGVFILVLPKYILSLCDWVNPITSLRWAYRIDLKECLRRVQDVPFDTDRRRRVEPDVRV